MYDNLFSWLVKKLNTLLGHRLEAVKSSDILVVGVLDIFGFENFKSNSFEQLCINTANEQLQYVWQMIRSESHRLSDRVNCIRFFFNEHIFRWELEDMKKEGVASNGCEFVDNGPIVQLLLGKPAGIFAILDEEALFPRSTDSTVIHKLHDKQGANEEVYDSMNHDQLHFKV